MKTLFKSFVISLALFLFGLTVDAQDATDNYEGRVSIAPMIGYQFGGRIRFYDGDLNIKDNINYGGVISVKVQYNTFVEVSYSYMQTEANFYSYSPLYEDSRFDLDVHYIMLSGFQEFTQGVIRPYGMLGAGMAGFVPKDLRGASSTWSFALSLGGGVKYMITPRIGIRAQGRLLMPLRFGGFGIYAGTGGAGVNTYSTVNIVQGDFSAGLIIAF